MKLRNKKTGYVWDIPKMRHPTAQEDDISFFAMQGTVGTLFSYKSLAELNDEWEDYNPTEPLIKDEKIREAVRAWWECCQEGISDKRVCIINGEFRIGIYRLDLGRHYFFDDKKEGFYTIDELCGTPEPIEPTFIDLDERIKEKEEE